MWLQYLHEEDIADCISGKKCVVDTDVILGLRECMLQKYVTITMTNELQLLYVGHTCMCWTYKLYSETVFKD